jgi:DNA-binding beta-propeller fold protein YncE
MNRDRSPRRLAVGTLSALAAALLLFALPGSAPAAGEGQFKHPQPPKSTPHGTLTQLKGAAGCLVGGGKAGATCGRARALQGPGPFMGSRAIAISPDGRNVYVASSKSDAIAVFSRNRETGTLSQPKGKGGCVAAKGAEGCAVALGLVGPNSVAVSADGRFVYATSREGASLTSFHRNRKTGSLRQLPPSSSGCISDLPIPGCTAGRALKGPDVVVVSGDGKNVYVGSFFGNAVASFSRNPTSGALTQLGGSAGCIADGGAEGCATGTTLGSIEGLAVAPDGSAVYAAAAVSNAVDVLARDGSTGALSQATDGSGCIVQTALAGCTTGDQIAGANAVASDGQGGNVYVTSLFSNSVTSFTTAASGVGLTQIAGPGGCLVYLRSPGCTFGRAMVAPEGLTVSNDGLSVYVAAFKTGALDVLDRNPKTGSVEQKPGVAGCVAPKKLAGCTPGRALAGVSSVVVSPDGRNVYSTAYGSNAVDVFRRVK